MKSSPRLWDDATVRSTSSRLRPAILLASESNGPRRLSTASGKAAMSLVDVYAIHCPGNNSFVRTHR